MKAKIVLIRLAVLLGSFLLISCQSTDKKFYPYRFDAEAHQKLSNAQKVFLLPTQLFHPKGSYDKNQFSPLDTVIKAYLEKQGFDVRTSDQVIAIWNKNKSEMGGFYDQNSGKIITSRVRENSKKTLDDLTNIADFSALIIPTVLIERIQLTKKSPNKAVWDGVTRAVDSSHGRNNGWMQHVAMSLGMVVTANNSLKPIFIGKGGIGFVTKNVVEGSTYSRATKEFAETPKEHLLEAVEIAFYPFINSELVEKTMPDSYHKMVYRKLYSYVKYPEDAKKQQLKDKVIARFKITASGDVRDLQITKLSKHDVFNKQIISAIKAASPFPSPPARFFKEDVIFEIPLVFKPDQ